MYKKSIKMTSRSKQIRQKTQNTKKKKFFLKEQVENELKSVMNKIMTTRK